MLFFIITMWLVGNGQCQNLRSYYFPYPSLTSEYKVYKYVNTSNPQLCSYWKMFTQVTKKDTIFISHIYDANGLLIEIFEENIEAEGVNLQRLCLFSGDSLQATNLSPKAHQVFKWTQKMNETIEWKTELKNIDPNAGIIFTKQRELKVNNITRDIANQTYACLQFADHFITTGSKTDSILYESDRNAYYASGIGLVEFENITNKEVSERYVLTEMYKPSEWEVYAARYLNQK